MEQHLEHKGTPLNQKELTEKMRNVFEQAIYGIDNQSGLKYSLEILKLIINQGNTN